MRISNTILSLALARLLTGALRYTDDYSPQVLQLVWRRTGLRQRDLDEALEDFCTRGWLRRYEKEGRERYHLTIQGAMQLNGQREPRWKHWREDWLLGRLSQRGRAPEQNSLLRRRDSDLVPA